jgi:peptidoglycan/LPS O-acetylase OafA/YrhL
VPLQQWLSSADNPDDMTTIATDERVTISVDLEELQEPTWLYQGRVPGLDGLRGLAILMVCAFHASWTTGWPKAWTPVARSGDVGVDLFLAVSGFLITLLLVRSQRVTGKVNLPAFYWRRTWRIFPAYICYLLVICVLHYRSVTHIDPEEWLAVLTCTTNFLPNPHWTIGHFWSLSMEEQFYLLWPLALALVDRKKLLKAAVGCMFLLPLIRWGIWGFNWNLFFEMRGRHPITRLDALVVGCVVGLAVFLPAFRRSASLTTGKAYVLALLSMVVLLTSIPSAGVGFYPSVFFRLIYALAATTLLWVAVSQKAPLFSWLLNCRVMLGLGAVSYSLYLWQQMFLFPGSPKWFMHWPVNALFALACGTLSYFLVERPFLRLKQWKWARQDSNPR